MEPLNPKKKKKTRPVRASGNHNSRRPTAFCITMLPEFIDLMSTEEIAIGQNGHLQKKQDSVGEKTDGSGVSWILLSGEIGGIGLGATYILKGVLRGNPSIWRHLQCYSKSLYPEKGTLMHCFFSCFPQVLQGENQENQQNHQRCTNKIRYMFLPRKFQLQNKHVLYVFFSEIFSLFLIQGQYLLNSMYPISPLEHERMEAKN